MYLLTDLEDPNTLVVFYIGCADCDKVLVNYQEFHNYSEDYRKEQCDKHTESTSHESFTLGSIVRRYICGECGAEWRYAGSLDEWSKEHVLSTGHKYFGFGNVTEDMYHNQIKVENS